MANLTKFVTEFIFMGFSDFWEEQALHAFLFFLIYLAALIGNLFIVIHSNLDHSLHSPMYFLLWTLSLQDLCFISVTIPKSIVHSLTQNSSISVLGCGVQALFFFGGVVCFLLFVVVVVLFACAGLALLKRKSCEQMVSASWLSGIVSGFLNTAMTFSLPFCRSIFFHQFFCENSSLLKLSCSEKYLAEIGSIILTTSLGFVYFVSIIVSYIQIFSMVLRILSVEGRLKAFSTCFPHLLIVTIFFNTGSIAYLKPVSESLSIWDLLVSVSYAVVPPTVNPIIYSLNKKDMKAAFWKILKKNCV